MKTNTNKTRLVDLGAELMRRRADVSRGIKFQRSAHLCHRSNRRRFIANQPAEPSQRLGRSLCYCCRCCCYLALVSTCLAPPASRALGRVEQTVAAARSLFDRREIKVDETFSRVSSAATSGNKCAASRSNDSRAQRPPSRYQFRRADQRTRRPTTVVASNWRRVMQCVERLSTELGRPSWCRRESKVEWPTVDTRSEKKCATTAAD